MKWHLSREQELPLWVADMDFKVPPTVVSGLQKRVAGAFYPYTYAWPSIREAFASWCKTNQKWDPLQGDFLLAPGLLTALMAALQAYTAVGEGVIVQAPVYGPFFSIPKRLGRTLMVNQLLASETQAHGQFSYQIDFEDFEKHCRAGAKAFVLCSPHNPVGRVWTQSELQTLGELCRRYKLWLIVDEIHADMIAEGQQFVASAHMLAEGLFDAQRTLVLQAPSKTFNIPGIGCGLAWSLAMEPVRELRACLSDLSMGSINILAMNACENAYLNGQAWFDEVKQVVDQNANMLSAHQLEAWPNLRIAHREGSFLTWIDCKRQMEKVGMEDEQWNRHIREKAKVFLSPGTYFGIGGEGHVRLNLGCTEANLLQALARLDRVFS